MEHGLAERGLTELACFAYNVNMAPMLLETSLPIPLRAEPGGTIRVGRTRVTLDTVAHAYLEGASAEEIVDRFPTLALADVHAVIAYYLTHRSDVEAYLRAREAEASDVRKQTEAHTDQRAIRERLLARQKRS